MVVANTLAKTEIQAFWNDSNLFFTQQMVQYVLFRDII